MKIRTDFVTNSSSSSFSVLIKVKLVNGKEISYKLGPVDSCDEDIGPVGLEDLASEKVLKASTIEQLCKTLENIVQNYTGEERYTTIDEYIKKIESGEDSENNYDLNFESVREHFQKTLKDKKKFSKKIKKECSSLDDIETVIISGDYWKTGEYCGCDAINDKELVNLAKKVVSLKGEEKEEAISNFLGFIKNSNRYVLINEKRVESLAKELVSGYVPDDEETSHINEINIKSKTVKEYSVYYL